MRSLLLWIHLIGEDFLAECFRELERNKAAGVDGVSVKG